MASTAIALLPAEIWSQVGDFLIAQDHTQDVVSLMRISKTVYEGAARSLYRRPNLNECNIKGFLLGLDSGSKRKCVWAKPQNGRLLDTGRREKYIGGSKGRERKMWLLSLVREVVLYERPFNSIWKRIRQIERHHDILEWVLHNVTGTSGCSSPLLPSLRVIEYTGDIDINASPRKKLQSHRLRMVIRLEPVTSSVDQGPKRRRGMISSLGKSAIPPSPALLSKVCILVELKNDSIRISGMGHDIMGQWLLGLTQKGSIRSLTVHAASPAVFWNSISLRYSGSQYETTLDPSPRLYFTRLLSSPVSTSITNTGNDPIDHDQIIEAEVERYLFDFYALRSGRFALYDAFRVHDSLPDELSDRLRSAVFAELVSELGMTHYPPGTVIPPLISTRGIKENKNEQNVELWFAPKGLKGLSCLCQGKERLASNTTTELEMMIVSGDTFRSTPKTVKQNV